MITKGFIEEIVSPYEVRVRIPTLDRSLTSSIATATEDLNIATICTLPNCYVNLQVGDVVFVGFEDNTYYKAVILGHLCRDEASTTYADLILGNLTVKNGFKIGDITQSEISQLVGVRDNLQKQIDNLSEKLLLIQQKLGD